MMQTILHLKCSPKGHAAHSSQLSEEVAAQLLAANAGAKLLKRDLAANPPPVPDAAFSAAMLSGASANHAAFAASEVLIGELEACDALVIGTPMHNYCVPAVLKAWVDQIVRINRCFRSTPMGKVGMLHDRPVFVVVASGGYFTSSSPNGTPPQPDFLTPYLRAIFGTIGLHDVHFITLEGLTRGPDAISLALANARAQLERLIPTNAAVAD
jgi:FMN-dependent NADH-azoreductase